MLMVNQSPPPSGSRLAPAPLVLSALAPYTAGALLAPASGLPLRYGVFFCGLVGVAALVVTAYAAREAWAPGWGRGPSWPILPPADPRRLAHLSLAVAAALGLILQFIWRTGDLTIPLGGLGALGGYFYFAPPLRWGRRGLGEAFGALCFGLLPVTAGLYLQGGHLLSEVLLYGLPLSFAGFNLFLIYGFPGPGAAPGAERFGLACRLGPVAGALLFTVLNVLTILSLAAILFFPAPALPGQAALWPLLVLAVVIQELVKRKSYLEEAGLKRLGRLTLALHLGLGWVFVLMLWLRL
jgi:1,4-dihydroxy-2-naphthoate octaprenyltransferase